MFLEEIENTKKTFRNYLTFTKNSNEKFKEYQAHSYAKSIINYHTTKWQLCQLFQELGAPGMPSSKMTLKTVAFKSNLALAWTINLIGQFTGLIISHDQATMPKT